MRVSARDTLLAIKVLSVTDGLVESDRRVGVALIEHFNRKTGQCDPSLARLARVLALSERTIIRSVGRLERAGFFKKARHGGNLNRNSYEPMWRRFAERGEAWNLALRSDRRARMSQESHSACRPSQLAGDSHVNQTCFQNNLHNATGDGRPKKRKDHPSEKAVRYEAARTKQTTSSTEAARTEAERRWTAALHRRFGHEHITYAEILELITPEIQVAATDAELSHRGGGLTHLVRRLRLEDDRC